MNDIISFLFLVEYTFVTDYLSLSDARAHCSSLGKILTTPTNQCEADKLREFTSKYHLQYNFGGTNVYWLNIETQNNNHPKNYKFEGRWLSETQQGISVKFITAHGVQLGQDLWKALFFLELAENLGEIFLLPFSLKIAINGKKLEIEMKNSQNQSACDI